MADEQPPERIKTVTWEDPRAAAREARRLSGADFFDAMRRGKLPEPPFGKLLGIDLFDAGDGIFKMSLPGYGRGHHHRFQPRDPCDGHRHVCRFSHSAVRALSIP